MTETTFVYVLFVIGIILIVKGGDFFVDASSWIASVLGIPKFIVGATIVSVATTMPELLVSLFASLDGKVQMAVGNAVGSVTANIGLIMAISIICIPCFISRRNFAIKGGLMVASCVVLLLLSMNGSLKFIPSIFLLIIFAFFIYENINGTYNKKEKVNTNGKEIIINILKFVLGATGIIYGADMLVKNGSVIASMLGVSESIIGVTVIAIGTSLPELVTTVTAVVKKESSLSIGNILGANIIDLTLILPLCSLTCGGSLPISYQSTLIDIPVCLLVSIIAVVPALIYGKFKRSTGFILLGIYLLYLISICV